MKKPQTHKSSKGFTLIEMLIAIAIIAILASVAIPQYSQYKIRGYDAQTKQALKDMHLLCNAYWLDTSTLQGCDLPKIKEPTYGFNQNADVVATLPPSPQDNFCASAKHNDSPNTFSIDSASLISSGSDCTGSSGTVQTASVTGSLPKEIKAGKECAEGFTFISENYWQGKVYAKVNDQHSSDNGLGLAVDNSNSFEEIKSSGQGLCVAFANEQYYVQKPGEEGVMNYLSDLRCMHNATGMGTMPSGFCAAVNNFLKDTGQGTRTCQATQTGGMPVCMTWLKSNTERTRCAQYGIDCPLVPGRVVMAHESYTEYQKEREIEAMLWKKYHFEENEDGGGWTDPGPPIPLRPGEHQIHFHRVAGYEGAPCNGLTPAQCIAAGFGYPKEGEPACKKYADKKCIEYYE
jgi:prepilin-type N-terminal cleavage/methylation domain-containing protein